MYPQRSLVIAFYDVKSIYLTTKVSNSQQNINFGSSEKWQHQKKMHCKSERKDQAVKKDWEKHIFYTKQEQIQRVVYQYRPQDKNAIDTAIRG